MSKYANGSKILKFVESGMNRKPPEADAQLDPTDLDYWRSVAIFGLVILPNRDVFKDFLQTPSEPSGFSSSVCGGGGDSDGGSGGGGCGGCGGCGS